MRGLRKAAAALVICSIIGGTVTACGEDNSGEGTRSEQQVQDPSGIAWKAKAADKYGTMVYQPPDSHPNGEILSTNTRKYDSSAEDIASTRPDGVIFQLPDFSTKRPVAFSTSDGPTGFDGPVPTGYTHSAAGAALAGSAYSAAYLSKEWPTFLEKVAIGSEQDKNKSREFNNSVVRGVSEDVLRNIHRPGAVVASTGVKVEMLNPNYARVTSFDWGKDDTGAAILIGSSSDLEWAEGMWKIKLDGINVTNEVDKLPDGAWTWTEK